MENRAALVAASSPKARYDEVGEYDAQKCRSDAQGNVRAEGCKARCAERGEGRKASGKVGEN
jgi:hypothetical protein